MLPGTCTPKTLLSPGLALHAHRVHTALAAPMHAGQGSRVVASTFGWCLRRQGCRMRIVARPTVRKPHVCQRMSWSVMRSALAACSTRPQRGDI